MLKIGDNIYIGTISKGGVGKTTVAINTAYALGEANKKILVVDCDKQENSYKFFADENGTGSTRYPNVHVTKSLDELEDYGNSYDFAIIGLPPAINPENVDILKTCDLVLISLEVRTFSLQGLGNTSNFMDINNINCAYFVNFHEKNNSTKDELLKSVTDSLKGAVMQTYIPRSNVIANSIDYKLTAFEYMKWTNAVISLGDFTEEVLERIEGENG